MEEEEKEEEGDEYHELVEAREGHGCRKIEGQKGDDAGEVERKECGGDGDGGGAQEGEEQENVRPWWWKR